MKTVNIADLKAQLSAHLHRVKSGEELVVCDRNKPVARIVPIEPDYSTQEQHLIARGLMIPPRRKPPKSVSWPEPPGDLSDEVVAHLWREERGTR